MGLEPVLFSVIVKKGKSVDDVINSLHQLAGNEGSSLKLSDTSLSIGPRIGGRTDQGTYEYLFGAQLSYKSGQIQNPGRPASQYNYWVEVTPAIVPPELEEKIESVKLESYAGLC